MYGDDDYTKSDRPLSFAPSPLNEGRAEENVYSDMKGNRARPSASINGNTSQKSNTSPGLMQSPRSGSFEKGSLSPSLSLREHHTNGAANAQFPLNDLDYGSNPAAVAQELSNLQALRRMSMDVGNTSDPDLPSFSGLSLMPSVAPTGDDNEEDPSRLFWVPARVHPELAPMEFKTFLENRVQSIKRRSGDSKSLSPDGMERSGSVSSLKRKKSMLSRQINNEGGRGAVGYKDGAEQIERKKSLSSNQSLELKIADLQELDALVRDPTKAMQKLSLDSNRNSGADEMEDMPILPQAPGLGLRRSTRTTYRRGSVKRIPFSKRHGGGRADTDGEESPVASPIDGRPPVGYPLTKVQSEPASPENFSRPNRGGRRLQNLPQGSQGNQGNAPVANPERKSQEDTTEASRGVYSANDPVPAPGAPISRSSTFPRNEPTVPQIVETPPPEESRQKNQFPERSSSQNATHSMQKQAMPEPPLKSNRRPTVDRQNSSSPQAIPRVAPSQTLSDMTQQPSPLPGNTARLGTDSLTFIPTLDEKKHDKRSKKEKEKEEQESSHRKTSWGWFDKKDKKKDEDNKKSKVRVPVDKSHDTARLDVLQSTMDAPRGRESLLLDRDSMDNRLETERKKEGSRKSGEQKKEKDGLFSSFFGGGKKKGDRDSGGKKGTSLRALSPDPPHRQLKPDIDYNWTRFSILEERAIYRMAHIKLANPRRALYSQVLLSNFMYSYLAKVQQMHPQMAVPQSAAQKKQEAERRQKEQQQQAKDNGEEQYRYDYHRVRSPVTN
jgi:hypothetical protein